MKKILNIVSSIIILIFFFVSCKKNVEDRIDGMWRRVNVIHFYSDTFEDWSFDGKYLYILRTIAGSQSYDTLGYGGYTIKASPFRKQLTMTDFTIPYYSMSPTWSIEKLTHKYLTLYRPYPGNAGSEYLEFTKK
jgi:hypothetical protein